jgi:hypothetical protein
MLALKINAWLPYTKHIKFGFARKIPFTVNLKYARHETMHALTCVMLYICPSATHTELQICNMNAISQDAAKRFQDEMETAR